MIQEQDKKLEKYSKDIYKVLISDEILLRYLHYIPTSRIDDPLDTSKENILDKDIDTLWGIIDDVIVPAPKLSDIVETQKSRLLVYAGYGRGSNSNYLFSNQEYEIDIFVHADTQTLDFRMEKIHDRVNELLFNKHIAGLGKLLFKGRQPIGGIKDYIGYKLIYHFSSENY
jgi:hypothetical protein